MIGKKPAAPEHSRGFEGLIAYVRQASKADYVIMNRLSSLDNAVVEMKLVAEMNTAVKDPVYHLILSWPKHERPTKEQIEDAVKKQVRALGYQRHQWIAAVHNDSDNIHVHIAINKVNPDNYRVVNPRGDFFTIDRTCREIELEQGWTHDRGPYCVEFIGDEPLIIEQKYRHLLRQLSDGGKKIERYTGDISFERYVQESETLRDIFRKSSSWSDLHNKLRIFGLEIHRADGRDGLVLRDTKSDAHAKACCIAGYSFEDMKSRLGRFQEDTSGTDQEIETVLSDMSRMKATFSERDLDGYLSAFVDTERQDDVKRGVMESSHCVHLSADDRGTARFTTKAVEKEEGRAFAAANRLARRPGRQVADAAVTAALSNRSMRDDQLDVYHRVIAGKVLCTIKGRAGVGKSYLKGALRDAYEGSGFPVIALGPTNIIADADKKDGFKEAHTIDKIIHDARTGKLRWGENTVLIVDEAGMISNDKYAEFLELADRHKVAKIILVGDERQLPAVERGGLFAMLGASKDCDCGAVKKITRQKNERQRQAACHLSEGEFDEAIHIYHEDGLIKWSGTDDEAREALLDAWKKDFESEEMDTRFILSYRNVDVDYFNREVHDYLLSKGKIHTPAVLNGAEYGLNEAILFTATNKKLGVTNGMRGTIKSWLADGMIVELENSKVVAIPLAGDSKFSGFRQAHAGTVYKSQGATIARTYLHHTRDWKDASGYVALTRQTKSATIFASREVASDWRDIARQMCGAMTKRCASSFTRATEKHVPKPIVGALVGDAARLVTLLADEIAERKAISDAVPSEPSAKRSATAGRWKSERTNETAKLKDRLFRCYLNERAAVDEQAQANWIAAVAAARRARDTEVSSLRSSAETTSTQIKAAAAGAVREAMLNVHRVEMRAAVSAARGRHRSAIAAVAGRKPKPIEFEGWLDTTKQVEDVLAYREWRQSAHDRHSDRHIGRLVDLCRVMADAGWQRDAMKGFGREQRWSHRDGRSLIILTDSDDSGVRWVHPESRQGGGFESLLRVLYSDSKEMHEVYRRYLIETKSITDKNPHHESDRFDHRAYDVVAARRDWESGVELGEKISTVVGSIPVADLIHELGARAADARLVRRPGGAAILAANRDQEGNIVGYELISATYRTAVRGSCLGFGFAIAAAARIDIGRRRQEETPDIKRRVSQLVTLEAADLLTLPEAIGMASIRAAKAGAEFLARHPRTWTAKEARAIANLEAVSANAEVVWDQAAAARRAELETADIVAAGRTIREADISDENLRGMNPVDRREYVSGIDSAVRAFTEFHAQISQRVRYPDEISMLGMITDALARLRAKWLDIMTSDQQRAVYDIVAKNLGNSKIMEELLGRTGTIYARQCAEEIMNYPFQVPPRIPHVDKAEAVIKAIDQHQAQPIATTASSAPVHVKKRINVWTPPIP